MKAHGALKAKQARDLVYELLELCFTLVADKIIAGRSLELGSPSNWNYALIRVSVSTIRRRRQKVRGKCHKKSPFYPLPDVSSHSERWCRGRS